MSKSNSEALESAGRLVGKALQYLAETQGAAYVRQRPVPTIRIKGPGSVAGPVTYEPDWSATAFDLTMAMTETPEYEAFKQAMEDDQRLNSRVDQMIRISIQGARVTPQHVFESLLSASLRKCGETFQLPGSTFRDVWSSVTGSLLAKHTSIRFWSVLENVEVPVGPVELLPNVFIRGLSNDQIEELWTSNKIVQDYYPFESNYLQRNFAGESQTLIETEVKETIAVGEANDMSAGSSLIESVMSSFDSICTAIRLIRPEQISMLPIIVDAQLPWFTKSAYGGGNWNPLPHGRRCILSTEELSEVQKLLQIVRSLRGELSGKAGVFLRRMGMANTRVSLEDKLLDAFIALEAMVLSDSGERGELSFRMSIRLARFLSANSKERQDIFHKSRKAYDLRSTVVHGGQLKPSDKELIPEFLEIAAKATRKYLQTLNKRPDFDWNSLMFD